MEATRELVIERAYGTGEPGFPSTSPVMADCRRRPSKLRPRIPRLDQDFRSWSGFSTTPRCYAERIEPALSCCASSLRPPNSCILPGGFCRTADQADARAVSMGEGTRATDVWVISDKAVAGRPCCRRPNGADRRIPGVVPRRAADNLFWLGRYLERAEATLRLPRARHADADPVHGRPETGFPRSSVSSGCS